MHIHQFKGIAVVQTQTQNISENVDLDFQIECAGNEWTWNLPDYGRDGICGDLYASKEEAIKGADAYGEAWVFRREQNIADEVTAKGGRVV